MSSYWLARNGQKYGPYPLEQLQQMAATGQVASSDSVWQEGMPNWVPLTQVVSVPAAANISQTPSFTPSFSYNASSGLSATGPTPPSLHWALVLVFGIFTLGLFSMVWILVEANFARKLEHKSGPLILAVLAVISWACQVYFQFGTILATLRGHVQTSSLVLLIELMTAVLVISWAFYMRGILVQYYNSIEPINLRLSGVMTFFFSMYYFQHHFRRIAEGKRTGVLQPQ
jgi:hypothetical protein